MKVEPGKLVIDSQINFCYGLNLRNLILFRKAHLTSTQMLWLNTKPLPRPIKGEMYNSQALIMIILN